MAFSAVLGTGLLSPKVLVLAVMDVSVIRGCSEASQLRWLGDVVCSRPSNVSVSSQMLFGCISVAVWVFVRFMGCFLLIGIYVGRTPTP
jgi:hypothetical protein